MTLERGALLHKRYRIVEILGQGGMGSVYRAVDENLGVDVAVKENLFTTDEYARQFRLEAVILANLRHPNLPRVTDHFVIGDQGQYLVMDYIEGEDLRQRMERVGNITEDDAILLGAAMCDALTYLHTRKPPILHRDIKPGNVKITNDGHIFLVDFGLAKILHGSQVTTTGARAMTPGYSPPEQYGTARTDPRTDVYSLGATLYAALSGIIPEDGLARAMDNTQLTPLRKRNSKVSRKLSNAIERAMGVDPAERFQTADEFKQQLLGSKSKTQRLPGDYVIEPPPLEPNSQRSNPLMREAGGEEALPSGALPAPELPAFKPPKRKRKGFLRRLISAVLWIVLLAALALVGLARFSPNLLPPQIIATLESLQIPYLFPATPSEPTATPLPTLEPDSSPTAVPVTPTTPANTLVPTATLAPPTPKAAAPVATALGGSTGQIAFASSSAGVPQIYIVNLDGTELLPLTNMEDGACQPAWSPDGSQLVFISPCPSRAEFYEDIYAGSGLFLINADGSGLQGLSSSLGGDFDPAWSPDGKQVAFTSMRDGLREIYVMDVASLKTTRLTTTNGDAESSQPAWSPDGSMIAYNVNRFDAYQVWVMKANGEDPLQLVRSGQDLWDYLPVWSADGESVIFNQRYLGPTRPWLMTINVANSQVEEATLLNLPAPIEDVQFSPDGLWIVFESSDSEGNRDIYLSNATGGNRTRLTTDRMIDFDPAFRPAPQE